MHKRNSVVIAMASVIGVFGALFIATISLTVAASSAAANNIGKTGYERDRELVWLDDKVTGRSSLPLGYDADVTSISSNGRWVAFTTDAALISDDINQLSDVYVRDMTSGEVELISRTSSGTVAIGPPGHRNWLLSHQPSISGNGRFVAFQSSAVNLVHGDTNLADDIFVHDRRSGILGRVSISSQGEESRSLFATGDDSGSTSPSIDAKGKRVAFTSGAFNLVRDDTNKVSDVFIHDRNSGTTSRVSVASDGAEANGASSRRFGAGGMGPAISGNGRFVAFDSVASNLVPDDTNLDDDVYVHDLKIGTTDRISVASNGSDVRGDLGSIDRRSLSNVASSSALSHDGRYVTFSSTASNLVPNDTSFKASAIATSINGTNGRDVFVYDRKTGRTERLSLEPDGREIETSPLNSAAFYSPSISPDGRYVVVGALINNREPGSSYYAGGPTIAKTIVYDRMTQEADLLHIQEFTSSDHPDVEFVERIFLSHSLARYGRFLALAADSKSFKSTATFWADRGDALGAVITGNSPPKPGDPAESRICVNSDICIPPGAAISTADAVDDLNPVLTELGANLYGASLAYRPQYEDLFAAIELEHMPKVTPGASPIFYGLRFEVKERSYEVRATPVNLGTFGLFDCTDSATCTKIADLRGGFGTTGMRVVFSLPLDVIGLENGETLSNVEALSGVGTFEFGAPRMLDTMRLN